MNRLFENEESVKNMFKALENVTLVSDMRTSAVLKDHALIVMCTLDEAIMNLDDLDYVQELLYKVGKSHRSLENYRSSVFFVSSS